MAIRGTGGQVVFAVQQPGVHLQGPSAGQRGLQEALWGHAGDRVVSPQLLLPDEQLSGDRQN